MSTNDDLKEDLKEEFNEAVEGIEKVFSSLAKDPEGAAADVAMPNDNRYILGGVGSLGGMILIFLGSWWFTPLSFGKSLKGLLVSLLVVAFMAGGAYVVQLIASKKPNKDLSHSVFSAGLSFFFTGVLFFIMLLAGEIFSGRSNFAVFVGLFFMLITFTIPFLQYYWGVKKQNEVKDGWGIVLIPVFYALAIAFGNLLGMAIFKMPFALLFGLR